MVPRCRRSRGVLSSIVLSSSLAAIAAELSVTCNKVSCAHHHSTNTACSCSIQILATIMSSARNLIRPVREVAFRPRPQVLKRKIVPITQTRFASGDQKVTPVPPGQEAGANEGQLPHVSEEQAEMDKTMGETPPDIGQGTPVQDVSDVQLHSIPIAKPSLTYSI